VPELVGWQLGLEKSQLLELNGMLFRIQIVLEHGIELQMALESERQGVVLGQGGSQQRVPGRSQVQRMWWSFP
jgi:hypothetical protein